MIKFIKNLNERQSLINYNNRYFLVSESKPNSIVRTETLVFECDVNGKILDWTEVDGEIGVKIGDFLPRLLERGYLNILEKQND
jgi:hypothetical protein